MNAKKKLWFYKKLHSLMNAGLNLRAILVGLAENNKQYGSKIMDAVRAMDLGEDFSSAIKYIFHLNSTEECLLQAAQQTGNVPKTINSIVEYSEKNAKFKKEINGALLRPSITFVIACAIFAMVTTVVIPKITASLPMKTTPIFMVVLTAVGKFIPFFIIIGFLLLIGTVCLYYLKPIEFWKILYKIPIIGPIKKHDSIFTFFLTVSLLCEGGISLEQALQTVSHNMNAYFGATIEDCIFNLQKGKTIRTALEDSDLLPFYIMEIIDTAEQSGDYAYYFREASILAEADFQESKNTLLPIIEMAVLCTVAVVIITTLLSVLIPIQQLGSSVFSGSAGGAGGP